MCDQHGCGVHVLLWLLHCFGEPQHCSDARQSISSCVQEVQRFLRPPSMPNVWTLMATASCQAGAVQARPLNSIPQRPSTAFAVSWTVQMFSSLLAVWLACDWPLVATLVATRC